MPKYENLSPPEIEEVVNKRKLYLQNYRDTHKEKLKQWKIENEEKLKKYREENKEKAHNYYVQNIDKFKTSSIKYRAKTEICECGCEVKSYNMNNHKFTKKHNALIKINNEKNDLNNTPINT
jgi:hypothetical protein